MKVIIEDARIEGVPVLSLHDYDCQNRRPVVIMLHGFTGRKEDLLPDAYQFVRDGFFVVTFDAKCHGGLESPSFRVLDYAQKAPKVFEIQAETTKFIDIILRNMKNNAHADFTRVGLVGFSMGGNIIYNYLSQRISDSVKAGIPILATPMWGQALRESRKKFPNDFSYFDDEKIKYVESIEPYNSLKQIRDFPLLMINGINDERASIDDIRRCYRELHGNYECKERIRLLEFAVGHTVVPEMIDAACKWFRQYLA